MATPKWVCMVIFALLTFTFTFANDNTVPTPPANPPSPPLTPTVPSPPPPPNQFSMNTVKVPPLHPFPLRPPPIIPCPPPNSPSPPPSETVPYTPPNLPSTPTVPPPPADTNTPVRSFPSVSKHNVPFPPPPPPPHIGSPIPDPRETHVHMSASAWTNGGDGGRGSGQVSGDAPGYAWGEGSREGGPSISTSGFAMIPRMGGMPHNNDANMWGGRGGLHSGSNPSSPESMIESPAN